MPEFTFAVPTLFGLEGVAAQELKRLGLHNVKGETGRVLCTGTQTDLCRMNLNLRTGERVWLVLGQFPAPNFDALFDGVKALNWEDFIPKDGQFPVRCQCVDSQLHAEGACESLIKKAIADRLMSKIGLTNLPETGPLYQVRCTILRDRVTIGLDSSGPALHKRGYRELGVAAPLRETLAAALVLLSRYRGKGELLDPFCGSGTIPIEAALIAKNRAPGLNRSFSAQKWRFIPQKCWMDAVDEALDKEYDGPYEICGSDIDPAAVALAQRNAHLAEVEDLITFSVQDAAKITKTADFGRVVTNPPYGRRLLERDEAKALYRQIGKTFSQFPKGWEFYILSSHPDFETAFGAPAPKKRKLYNGKLLCNLYQYNTK